MGRPEENASYVIDKLQYAHREDLGIVPEIMDVLVEPTTGWNISRLRSTRYI